MPKLRAPFLILFAKLGNASGCHQIPERCFCVGGYVFPLCARCCGVWVGQICAVAAWLLGFRAPVWLFAAMLAVMGGDWLLQYWGVLPSTNTRRFVTGILGGFGLWSIYFTLFPLLYRFILKIF